MTLVPASSGGGGGISGVTVTGTAASGQVPVASSASAGVWAFPPGYEISYTAITTGVDIASTTESSGTTIISPGAITFDGTAVLVHFFCPRLGLSTVGSTTATISLFEGATQITRLVVAATGASNSEQYPATGYYRFTPTAASHTYTVTAFASSTTGPPHVYAGSGGTGGDPPAFLRFTKV